MSKLLAIGQASKLLGVTIQTLRNWDKQGLLKPDELTRGGERTIICHFAHISARLVENFIHFFVLRFLAFIAD